MVNINRFLVLPAVDQQNGFRIVQRLVVLIPQVPGFRPDRGHGAAAGHFFSKLPGIAVFACISQVHCNGHHLSLFSDKTLARISGSDKTITL